MAGNPKNQGLFWSLDLAKLGQGSWFRSHRGRKEDDLVEVRVGILSFFWSIRRVRQIIFLVLLLAADYVSIFRWFDDVSKFGCQV